MQKRIQIPESPRYEFARMRAYCLLCQQEVSQLPVNPWAIAAGFPSIHVCRWTELQENCHVHDPLNIDVEGADAKTELRGASEYLIVYDDRVPNYRRIRWTMAHEIGHIVLGHLVILGTTARGSFREKEYKVLEREADWFAAHLLAPMTILNRINSLKTAEDFMRVCELSGEAAENCMKDLQQIKSGRRLPYPIKEEDVLFRQFFRYIRKANRDEEPIFRYDDLIIDAMYDDYIECDYWDFVVWVIRKWKGEPDLYRALRGSLALYDDEYMVIFVANKRSAEITRNGTGIILETLQKHADSCVRQIDVKVAVFR